jgi:hypothetical protein
MRGQIGGYVIGAMCVLFMPILTWFIEFLPSWYWKLYAFILILGCIELVLLGVLLTKKEKNAIDAVDRSYKDNHIDVIWKFHAAMIMDNKLYADDEYTEADSLKIDNSV